MENTQSVFYKKLLRIKEVKILFFLIIISFIAPFLANEKPLLCVIKGNLFFPILKSEKFNENPDETNTFGNLRKTDFKKVNYDFVIWPLIPYGATTIDSNSLLGVGPFGNQCLTKGVENEENSVFFRHWLGTNSIGNDLLSQIIHALKNTFLTSGIVGIFSIFIGVFLGTLSGLYENRFFHINLFSVILIFIPVLIVYLSGIFLLSFDVITISDLLVYSLVLLVAVLLFQLNKFLKKKGKRLLIFEFELKDIINPLMKLFIVIPPILIVMLFLNFQNFGYWKKIILICLFFWVDIFRIVSTGIVQLKQQVYYESAMSLGITRTKILLNYLIPSLKNDLIIAFLNNIPLIITMDATLSFLGIGGATQEINLGGIILEGRNNPSYWWLIVFPCALISYLLYLIYSISRKLNDHSKNSL